MNRIAILSNAGSGRNARKAALIESFGGLTAVHQEVTRSAADLPRALEALLARNPSVLAINGGDGTVHAVLTALGDRPAPPLAVLPAGSTNMTAHDLRCGGRLSRRRRALLALRDLPRETWPTLSRPPLALRCPDGRELRGFFFGMGMIVRGIEYWHASLRHGGGAGEWAAGAALLRVALGMLRREAPFDTPAQLPAMLDGDPLPPAPKSLFLASTMQRLFLGMTPFWGVEAGPLACTWLSDRPRGLGWRLPALLTGRARFLSPEAGFFSRRGETLSLTVEEPWVIDGEAYTDQGTLALRAASLRTFVALAGPGKAGSRGQGG